MVTGSIQISREGKQVNKVRLVSERIIYSRDYILNIPASEKRFHTLTVPSAAAVAMNPLQLLFAKNCFSVVLKGLHGIIHTPGLVATSPHNCEAAGLGNKKLVLRY